MKRLIGLGIVIAAIGLAAPARAEIIDRVMAVVGRQVVTLSDVRAAAVFGLAPTPARADDPEAVLAALVDRELMLSEVERYSAPEPEPAAVRKSLSLVRSRFASAPAFEQAMATTGMSVERLRAIVADNLRIETYVEQRFGAAAQASPEEVQRYYREHQAEFTRAGRFVPLEDLQAEVAQKATAERRRGMVAEWLDRLRRRSQGGVIHPATGNSTR
jgi:peptidyl-prolyl cis-trans isomerase SurA